MSESARFYTVEQVAALVQLTPKTIRRLIDAGRIPVARIGENVRIPTRWLDIVQDAALAEKAAPTTVDDGKVGAA